MRYFKQDTESKFRQSIQENIFCRHFAPSNFRIVSHIFSLVIANIKRNGFINYSICAINYDNTYMV